MSNTREFDDESFEAFLDALPDVDPPEDLKHSVFAAIDAGEHTSPIAQPIAEVVELPRRRTRGFFAAAAAAVMLVVVELASSSCVRRKTRGFKPRAWNRCTPSWLLMTS